MAWEPKTAQVDDGWSPKTAKPEAPSAPTVSEAAGRDPMPPKAGEGLLAYEGRRLIEDPLSPVGYPIAAVKSVGSGIGDIIDLFKKDTWTGDAPRPEGKALKEKIIKEGFSAPKMKEYVGALNEAAAQNPAGKVLGAAGKIVGAPVAPIVGEAIKQAEKLGLPHEYSELGLNALPAVLKAAGIKGPTPSEAAKYVGDKTKAAGKSVSEGASTMKTGYQARGAEELQKNIATMSAEGSKSFKAMRDSGVRIVPQASMATAQHVRNVIAESGKLDPALHSGTMGVLNDLVKSAARGLEVEDLHIFRQRFQEVANKPNAGSDGHMAREAIDGIDEAFEALKENGGSAQGKQAIESLQSGIKQWARMRKFETLADAVKRSGGNPQKLKTEFDKILNSPRKSRGFKTKELAEIRKASEYTTPEKLMRFFGRFGAELGDTKTVPAAVLPGLEILYGGAYHNPYMLPLVVGGTASRYGGKMLARGKAENALMAVEGRDTSISGTPLNSVADQLVIQ